MHVDERFLIRAFQAGDETAILELFARSFHTTQSREKWSWKYEQNPWGQRRISLAFNDAGALVGHYAGYPVAFVEDGRELMAHQIGDTMTDPSIRHIGRGPTSILGRTARHFYEHFCEGKVAFNYGFNVANIQKFSLRFLRSERVEPVTYRSVSASALRPVARLQRYAGGYQLEVVHRVGREWDVFFTRVQGSYRFLVRRDAQYVRWRYLQCPDEPYTVVAIRRWRRLVGWIAFRMREGRLLWGDALFDPDDRGSVGIVLRHVVDGFHAVGVDSWFATRPRWFSAELGELGFTETPEPQDLSLMCVPFALADAVTRMRERLYGGWGDGDLF